MRLGMAVIDRFKLTVTVLSYHAATKQVFKHEWLICVINSTGRMLKGDGQQSEFYILT